MSFYPVKKPKKEMVAKRALFLQLAAAGVEWEKMPAIIGVSRPTIYNWKREYKLPSRPQGKRLLLKIKNRRAKIAELQAELAGLEKQAEPQLMAVAAVEGTK
jgi:transposase